MPKHHTRDLHGRFRSPRVEDGPDFFGLYETEIDELLSRDDDLPSLPCQTSQLSGKVDEVGRGKGFIDKTCRTKESNGTGFAPLFSDGIGANLSELKKERLHSLLRQSVSTLKQEVDEMENPVLSVCRIRSCLKRKEILLDSSKQPQKKKAKLDPACSKQDLESEQLDDDLRFILENDSTKVEELLERHTNEISTTLDHMEKSLEGILDAVMTSCRTMNVPEKQQLRRLLRNLPAKNFDRVVEIVGRKNSSVDNSCNLLNIELERLDNVTLWRLYFYVATVEAAMSVNFGIG